MSSRYARTGLLMTYVSMSGGSLTVFNTRDGLTPMVFEHHGRTWVNVSHLDEYRGPAYVPTVGELAWVAMTAEHAQALVDQVTAGWPVDDPRRADLDAALTREVRITAGTLVATTPALRNALGVAKAERLWTPHNSHPGATWSWNTGSPYLTCTVCGAAHPSAALQLYARRHYVTARNIPDGVRVRVPADTLWLGQPAQAVELNAAHYADVAPSWHAEHQQALAYLADFRAEVPA